MLHIILPVTRTGYRLHLYSPSLESSSSVTHLQLNDCNRDLPLTTFVVQIKIEKGKLSRLLNRRRAAISINVTPPTKYTISTCFFPVPPFQPPDRARAPRLVPVDFFMAEARSSGGSRCDISTRRPGSSRSASSFPDHPMVTATSTSLAVKGA